MLPSLIILDSSFLEDEYKVMGLASYGKPYYLEKFRKIIRFDRKRLLDMDLSYFTYQNGRGFLSNKFYEVFGPPKKYKDPMTQRHMDLASSAQLVLEEIVLELVKYLKQITNARNLCMAGGVSLNCVANGKIADAGIFEDIHRVF